MVMQSRNPQSRNPQSRTKMLLKVLIGAAWIDGTIQVEERQYLRHLAEQQGLENDPELKPFLYELVSVKPEQCYAWIEEYLGSSPNSTACNDLLEAISALVYSDGSIEIEEARLLNHLQEIDAACSVEKPSPSAMLQSVQKIYRHWLDRLETLT